MINDEETDSDIDDNSNARLSSMDADVRELCVEEDNSPLPSVSEEDDNSPLPSVSEAVNNESYASLASESFALHGRMRIGEDERNINDKDTTQQPARRDSAVIGAVQKP